MGSGLGPCLKQIYIDVRMIRTCALSQSKEQRGQSSLCCTVMSVASAAVSSLASDSDCSTH